MGHKLDTNELQKYYGIQRENKHLIRANPWLGRKAAKLKFKNVGIDEVLGLNKFLKSEIEAGAKSMQKS